MVGISFEIGGMFEDGRWYLYASSEMNRSLQMF